MVAYVWTCHACGRGNPAGSDQCVACGCAATVSRASLERDLPELKAKSPSVRLEPQWPARWLIANMLAWTLTLISVPAWFFSSDSAVSYGFVALYIIAWAMRQFIARRMRGYGDDHT